jgi:hypothetical protein
VGPATLPNSEWDILYNSFQNHLFHGRTHLVPAWGLLQGEWTLICRSSEEAYRKFHVLGGFNVNMHPVFRWWIHIETGWIVNVTDILGILIRKEKLLFVHCWDHILITPSLTWTQYLCKKLCECTLLYGSVTSNSIHIYRVGHEKVVRVRSIA